MNEYGRSYRWVVLGSAFAIISMAIGMLFALAVFVEPMERSLGWSRGSLSAIAFMNWIVMGAGGAVAGYLADRFGTRIVVLVGSGLLGLGLILSSRVTEPWQFYLTFGVLVGGGVSTFYVPLTVTAVKWFDHRRAMAAAVVSSGNGLGILVLSPLARWLINEYDWRTAFVVLGDLAWLIVIPAALLLKPPITNAGAQMAPALPPTPLAPAHTNAGAPMAPALPPRAHTPTRPSHFPARGPGLQAQWAAVRTWPFWAIALTHFACCAAHSGPIFHMVSHAIDQGVPKLTAAAILGLSGLTSIFGRVGTGIIADRVGTRPTLIAALVLQAVTILLYLGARDASIILALALVFGVGYGAAMPLYAVLTRELFGERVMGTAYGLIFGISCIGMGLGSYAGGLIHDVFGSYLWLFIASGAIGSMAVVLALTLEAPRRLVTQRA
ncbi:MAG: MFS transporter [Candidatus Rokubacteria bacterium]|nr:MFS transporter [Candidatus Rokubacteria bacterium]